jgi:hypothetical protein
VLDTRLHDWADRDIYGNDTDHREPAQRRS